MKRGDWIEQRDTPNTRGIIKSVSNARHAPKVRLLVSGFSGETISSLRELEDGWEPMGPVGTEVPYWCNKGDAFKLANIPPTAGMGDWVWARERKDHVRSIIYDVQLGWVAYHEHFKGDGGKTEHPRFMMLRWWEFRKTWEPTTPPNAWQRVLNLED